MIWCLHAMESKGFEGTVLGTLIMPYCSGFANLIFAYVMSSSASNGKLVIENCLVNNVTNMTLLLGLSALLDTAADGTSCLSSQVGDGHICIPMCIGLFALFNPIQVPAF